MQTKTKVWSYKAGEKGRNRVRAYEDNKNGSIMMEFSKPQPDGTTKRQRVTLGHTDRTKAKQDTDVLAAKFGKSEKVTISEFSLQQLFDIYLREVTVTKGASKQAHDRRCATMFLSCWGRDCKPRSLSRRDWDLFIRQRRSGDIRPAGSRANRAVGNRVIAYDLKFAISVFIWAESSRDGRSALLLERNPFKGLKIPVEESPKRPRASHAVLQALLVVAGQVSQLLPLAFVLANETGHRMASIRQLRWSDINFQSREIRWRAENDKQGREHVTPLSESAENALRGAQKRSFCVGSIWVFPAPNDTSQPCSRNLLKEWWLRAEKLAGVEHVAGTGWHSLRRKFATELKDKPLTDALALGGWRSQQTLVTCYQQADENTMRNALQSRPTLNAAIT